MKNHILKSILFTLFVSVFTSCSENDEQEPFEPFTIEVTENFLTNCDQTVTIEGVDFTYRPQSMEEGGFNNSQSPCIFDDFNPIMTIGSQSDTYLVFLGSFLEIDFSRLQGVSKVTVSIVDFCAIGCTEVKLYDGDTRIETVGNETTSETEEIVFDNVGNANRLTLVSFEGFFIKIRFE